MASNIVHEYFKKVDAGLKILLKVDPMRLQAIELTVPDKGDVSVRDLELTVNFKEELASIGFVPTGPFEFNLYDAGLLG